VNQQTASISLKGFSALMKSVALMLSIVSLTQVSSAALDSQKLAETMTASKQKIVEAEAEKRRILGSLYSIQKRMKKITSEKSHLTDELFQAQDGVKSIAKVIATLEGEIGKQRIQLRRRLRALYKMSGQGYVGILFSRTNASDLDETLRFLKIVTDNDYKLIRSYKENVATYTAQKEKLKAQVERLVAIEKRIKKQEGLLAVQQQSKSKIVSELDRKRTANLDRIKSIRKKTEGMNDQDMDELLRPSIYEQKGMLASPVAAEVVQDFGLISEEKYKIKYSHKGWTFAPVVASVNSIFEGTIAKSLWVPGYGTTVVIDHGDHYYSVYAHISRMRANQGDTIKKGQSFADTDGSKGLYFEIRHFSEPENPALWIASQAL
jgi:murein hydrolase activator